MDKNAAALEQRREEIQEQIDKLKDEFMDLGRELDKARRLSKLPSKDILLKQKRKLEEDLALVDEQ